MGLIDAVRDIDDVRAALGLSGIAQCLGKVMTEFLDAQPLQTRCLAELSSRTYFVPAR